jgi:flavodoxin
MTVACASARRVKLSRQGMTVACASARRAKSSDALGFDLLVLGTYTHAAQASGRLRALCEAIPPQRFEQMAVALFGTQTEETRQRSLPGGIDELRACLEERGCELMVEPLRIGLPQSAESQFVSDLSGDQRRQVEAFAAELLEASQKALCSRLRAEGFSRGHPVIALSSVC